MQYSWLPITWTVTNSNQRRFPLDFLHTFTVLLPSVTRTLHNYLFPFIPFYMILPSIIRTMFLQRDKSEKKTVLTVSTVRLSFLLLQLTFSFHPCTLLKLFCLIPFSKNQSISLAALEVKCARYLRSLLIHFLISVNYLLRTLDSSNSYGPITRTFF